MPPLMPSHQPSHAALDRAVTLLDLFQEHVHTGRVQDLIVRDISHGEKRTRGLLTSKPIHDGEAVVDVPAEFTISPWTTRELEQGRFKDLDVLPKLGFWLVEQRAKQTTHECFSSDAKDQIMFDHIQSLPTSDELRSRGLSVYASNADLEALEHLDSTRQWTNINEIQKGVMERKQYVIDQLDMYNARRGDRPQLSLDEATWGYTIASSYNFGCTSPTSGQEESVLAPVAHLVNHAEDPDDNVTFDCSDGHLTVTATKEIMPGQEIRMSYKDGYDPISLLLDYGIVQPKPTNVSWTFDECAAIRNAKLGDRQGDSAFLKLVRQAADTNCSTWSERFEPQDSRLIKEVFVAGTQPFFAILSRCKSRKQPRGHGFGNFL